MYLCIYVYIYTYTQVQLTTKYIFYGKIIQNKSSHLYIPSTTIS